MKLLKQKNGSWISGIALGILYALITRILFSEKATMASLTYLFITPTVLAVIPLMFADNQKIKSYINVLFISWLTILSSFFTMLIVGMEDFIGFFILAAPFFIMGTISALLYGKFQINKPKNKLKRLFIVLIPFVFALLEQFIQSPASTFKISSEIVVKANPETIWNNIVEVQPIDPKEYKAGFFNSIGIPRPIFATVDKKETGGKRTGNFEGGLKFIETITEYEQNRKISFSIKIDPKTVRKKAFDQQVLNGNYFAFVDATYQLAELGTGKVKLSLSSSYKITSNINFYGKFWGNIILKDFQDRLLYVIQKRCEAKS